MLVAPNHLLTPIAPQQELRGWARAAKEFLYFGVKQPRACLFASLIFLAVFIVPRGDVLGFPRYLLVMTLAIPAYRLWAKLETWGEAKAIGLFHAVGFALEVFKTSVYIGSWRYPDAPHTKLWGVPLFLDFMYTAVEIGRAHV